MARCAPSGRPGRMRSFALAEERRRSIERLEVLHVYVTDPQLQTTNPNMVATWRKTGSLLAASAPRECRPLSRIISEEIAACDELEEAHGRKIHRHGHHRRARRRARRGWRQHLWRMTEILARAAHDNPPRVRTPMLQMRSLRDASEPACQLRPVSAQR